MRGNTYGRDADFPVLFSTGDVVVGAFGTHDTQYLNGFPCCNQNPVFRSIGFRTSSGKQYGPYGQATLGTEWMHTGPIRGFYGALTYNIPRSLGFYVDATSTPPALPAPPSPPPSPPARPSPPNLGRIKSSVGAGDPIGGATEVRWDDGPNYQGRHLWWQPTLIASHSIYDDDENSHVSNPNIMCVYRPKSE